MTKVTLAYAYNGHKADQTVDLPAGEASELLHAGRARKPAPATPKPPAPEPAAPAAADKKEK